MKKAITILFVWAMVFTNGASFAQRVDSDVTLSEIQTAMIDHMNLISRSDIAGQLQDLDLGSWQSLYDLMPTKVMYVDAVESMRQNAANSNSKLDVGTSNLSAPVQNLNSPLSVVAPMFTPVYPSGVSYNDYTLTLPGFQLLIDSPDIGTEFGASLRDERCDGNGEGGLRIATHALVFLTIAADAVCAGAGTFFCIPYGAAAAASYASEVVLQQCGYQTALVDSAEIEAAFENTVGIIGTVNDIDAVVNDETNYTSDAELAVIQNQISNHDADIKTNLNVHDAKINNNLSIHDTDIKTNLNAHDAKINNNLSIHDADIKNQLDTHDTEVKALLVALQGSVDVLLARQLEVVRLLHTPQGRRETNIPACNGASCDFPEK